MIVPFFIPHAGCPHQCIFCNQKNITGRTGSIDPSDVSRIIREYLGSQGKDSPAQVAFYGGSFTALPLETQKSYLKAIQVFIKEGRIKNIRLSTRPDCITEKILDMLKYYHVETIELGAQSMQNSVLASSGRGHTVEDTIRAVGLLREFKFRIGLQLMPGLPGDSNELFRDTVRTTVSLRPQLVRIYPTLVIRNTPLDKMYCEGRYTPLSLDEAVKYCKEAVLKCEDAGIDVIRIGLQPTEELEKPGTIIAGPYHPAFRQLVESSILRDRMASALSKRKVRDSEILFLVNPSDISNAIGQKRSNISALKKEFGLEKIIIQPDESVRRRNIRLVVS